MIYQPTKTFPYTIGGTLGTRLLTQEALECPPDSPAVHSFALSPWSIFRGFCIALGICDDRIPSGWHFRS